MRKPYILSEYELAVTKDLFNQGYGAATISLKLKVSTGAILRALKNMGLYRDPKEAMRLRAGLPHANGIRKEVKI